MGTKMRTGTAVWVSNLGKRYRARHWTLRDVALEVPGGAAFLIRGESGSGKTTLLNLLYGLERPDSGQIVVQGRNVLRLGRRGLQRLRRSIGYVFGDLQLSEDRTVVDNVALPLRIKGWWPSRAAAAAAEACRLVGLEEAHLKVRCGELAASERQLAVIARALVAEPDLILADEPTAHLDTRHSLYVLDLLARTVRSGATVLVASGEMLASGAFPADDVAELRDGHLSVEWSDGGHVQRSAMGRGDDSSVSGVVAL
ncbi:MAG: ATP-binding cassette domain-containing protein [Deltaproteobacteria bacterium]|nr:ATP-binding cassette domain-containing protein [Deltaproteobacteria bacterium]